MNVIEKSILGRFQADALREYGDRLRGLYVFDYPFDDDSVNDDEVSVDLDVAVVLADDNWRFLDEKEAPGRAHLQHSAGH